MSMDTGPSLMERYTGMDLETPLPSSKMYHAAPAPGGGSSANPPVILAAIVTQGQTHVHITLANTCQALGLNFATHHDQNISDLYLKAIS